MSRQPDKMAPAEVVLTVHPPERPRPAATVTLPCGCCCCCCCCLHTIGGLIGGIAGSVTPMQYEPRPVDPDFPFPFRRDEVEEDTLLPAGVLYWLMLSVLIVITALWYWLNEGTRRIDDLYVGVLVALFFLPGLQLGASFLAAIVAGLVYTDRVNALKRIGRITGWSLAGTAVGIAVMGGLCGMFSLIGR
jgi:hypothetical protein